MRGDIDGMLLIRAELCDRLESLRTAAGRMTMREFVAGVATIRTIAGAYGMIPVVCVAEAFERAIRAEPRGCPAGLYFERLKDAIGCGAADEHAGQAMLASISVRLSA
ncbi:MAG: hypothetical protein AB7O91_02295 [Sphingomonas sp.]